MIIGMLFLSDVLGEFSAFNTVVVILFDVTEANVVDVELATVVPVYTLYL